MKINYSKNPEQIGKFASATIHASPEILTFLMLTSPSGKARSVDTGAIFLAGLARSGDLPIGTVRNWVKACLLCETARQEISRHWPDMELSDAVVWEYVKDNFAHLTHVVAQDVDPETAAYAQTLPYWRRSIASPIENGE